MNEVSSGPKTNEFSELQDTVNAIVEFAEHYPSEVRAGIVQAILSARLGSTVGRPVVSAHLSGMVVDGSTQSGIEAVAADAGVEVATLARFIQIGDDGEVTIRARLGGNAAADRQNAYSAVLAYAREKALEELDTEIQLVRTLCKQHRCFDGNLTANLRSRRWLLEHGVKGGNKSYRLAPAGEDAARQEIRRLCAEG